MHSLLMMISSELSNIRKQLNAESKKYFLTLPPSDPSISSPLYLENTNDSQDLIDINVKKGTEEDEDFIGALQDIQVCIIISKRRSVPL